MTYISFRNQVKHEALFYVSKAIYEARSNNTPVLLMMGAHVIRSGVQRYIMDLMEKGYISCIAMNGAGLIHFSDGGQSYYIKRNTRRNHP